MLPCSHEQIRVGEAVELLVLSTSSDFDDFMAVKEARLSAAEIYGVSDAFTEFCFKLRSGGTLCHKQRQNGCLTACVRGWAGVSAGIGTVVG